jgi:hypothetical protein
MEIKQVEYDKPIYSQVGTEKAVRTAYMAFDGTEHQSEWSCKKYEEQLRHELLGKELFKDIPYREQEVFSYSDGYYKWYKFNSKEEFIACYKYIAGCYYSRSDEETMDEINFPQWISILCHDGGDYADHYTYITLDQVQADFDRLKNALCSKEE